MVKAYLRYVQDNAFGMIAGSSANMVFHPDGTSPNLFDFQANTSSPQQMNLFS